MKMVELSGSDSSGRLYDVIEIDDFLKDRIKKIVFEKLKLYLFKRKQQY